MSFFVVSQTPTRCKLVHSRDNRAALHSQIGCRWSGNGSGRAKVKSRSGHLGRRVPTGESDVVPAFLFLRRKAESLGKVKKKRKRYMRLTGGNPEQDQAHFKSLVVTRGRGYQRRSSMQMRTLSSPPLIKTPIKDSCQRGDSAIVIAAR